jgi:hypothetical protein
VLCRSGQSNTEQQPIASAVSSMRTRGAAPPPKGNRLLFRIASIGAWNQMILSSECKSVREIVALAGCGAGSRRTGLWSSGRWDQR